MKDKRVEVMGHYLMTTHITGSYLTYFLANCNTPLSLAFSLALVQWETHEDMNL